MVFQHSVSEGTGASGAWSGAGALRIRTMRKEGLCAEFDPRGIFN